MAPPGDQYPPIHTTRYEGASGQSGDGLFHGSQPTDSTRASMAATRMSSSGATAADNVYYSSGSGHGSSSGGQTAPPSSGGLPRPNAPPSPTSASARLTSPQRFEASRRSQGYGRQTEELHMPPSYVQMGQQSSREPIGNSSHMPYASSQETGRAGIQQGQHNTVTLPLPGALQPGNTGRPHPASVNTAPSTVPVLPQISTQAQSQPYPNPARMSSTSHAHTYSRSSPAAPFVNTPEDAKFATTPSHKYTSSQTPQAASHSPLGLADIRPRADSGMSDGLASANPYSNDGYYSMPTNCNHLAPWAVYAFDWCKWPVAQQGLGDSAGKMAIGSYLEDGHNYIQILDTQIVPDPEPDSTPGAPQYGIEFIKTAEATHSYPVTRILWEPEYSMKQSCDLLATSGDHLRLWSLPPQKQYNASNSITRSSNSNEPPIQKLTPLALLSNSKSPEHTAPLTSLDWNTVSPSLIITSSIDTTCTIWDIPSLTAKTQLIAHDKEVFDVRFCANSVDVFVSCGADGSVRMFDLRSLEHSTIIYEPSEKGDKSSSPGDISPTKAQQTMSYAPPLLRLAASPHDAHLLATFSQDSSIIRILDVRQPGQALLELQGHGASINCMEWSPSRRGTLASGGDDSLVLIWDLLNQSNAAVVPGANGNPQSQGTSSTENARGPAASWQCEYEVGNISWAPQSGLTSQGSDWLGVSGGRGLWAVNL
ncbi:hypothetical protein MMC34_000375 [Xylographa carneopallida]|nr:hypothetical protein [Xylographa carneopallida]